MSRYKIDPYLFDEKEEKVLRSLRLQDTPLKISKDTSLPRSTVYFILEKLKKRGLVKSIPRGKKKVWILSTMEDISIVSSHNSQQVRAYTDRDSIRDFLEQSVMADGVRFKCLNGDNIIKGWEDNVGIEEIVKFNEHLRKNDIISDMVSAKKALEDQVSTWGDEWIDSFAGKPTEYHLIENKYTNHGAQIFLKSNKVFLINMSKPLVVEIRDPEMAKMFESFFEMIKDSTKSVSISEILRGMK